MEPENYDASGMHIGSQHYWMSDWLSMSRILSLASRSWANLLHRHAAREHVPVADQRWLVHSCQQHLAGQGVREGIWLTAACQGTLLARIKVTKVTPDASICSGPQGQKKRGLSPSEHTDLWLGLVTVGVYNVINFGLCFLNR